MNHFYCFSLLWSSCDSDFLFSFKGTSINDVTNFVTLPLTLLYNKCLCYIITKSPNPFQPPLGCDVICGQPLIKHFKIGYRYANNVITIGILNYALTCGLIARCKTGDFELANRVCLMKYNVINFGAIFQQASGNTKRFAV